MTSDTLTETEATAKADIFEILSHAPGEVRGVQEALREGRIEGLYYEGDCCCLVGTIAKLRRRDCDGLPGISLDGNRPAEAWFEYIHTTHTPENNERARMTDGWLTEWLGMYGEPETPVQPPENRT